MVSQPSESSLDRRFDDFDVGTEARGFGNAIAGDQANFLEAMGMDAT